LRAGYLALFFFLLGIGAVLILIGLQITGVMVLTMALIYQVFMDSKYSGIVWVEKNGKRAPY